MLALYAPRGLPITADAEKELRDEPLYRDAAGRADLKFTAKAPSE